MAGSRVTLATPVPLGSHGVRWRAASLLASCWHQSDLRGGYGLLCRERDVHCRVGLGPSLTLHVVDLPAASRPVLGLGLGVPQASASWRSGGFSQRQGMPRTAPKLRRASANKPRAPRRAATRRPHRPCFVSTCRPTCLACSPVRRLPPYSGSAASRAVHPPPCYPCQG